jgi:hypothetical protein
MAVLAFVSLSCRNRVEKAAAEQRIAGEPDRYSAAVVRTIEDGERREVIETRIARAGEMFREQWVESVETRALIVRPDLGKSYLLWVDRRIYTEFDASGAVRSQADGARSTISAAVGPDEFERAFDRSPPIAEIKTRRLEDQTIDGHLCEVYEQIVRLDDGSSEVTLTHLARDLASLAIRVESVTEHEGRRIRVITERREIRTDVSPDEFTIPAGFRKVERPGP